MTDARNQARRIVEAALAIPVHERDAYVRRTCGGDVALLTDVLSWLRSAELAGGSSFLDSVQSGEEAVLAHGAGTAPIPPDRIRVGTRLGDLTLVRELGSGQQGRVFEAHQHSLDRQVAVKVLQPEPGHPFGQEDRFVREAEAAGRLNHPNVVTIHEIIRTPARCLIVQELVQGGNLADRLADREEHGKEGDSEAFRWAAGVCEQVARGLHHVHGHKVIHRDLKPANILFTPDGVPKLSDFGLALLEDRVSLSLSGAVLGTPKYMAPEQVEGRREDLDARTDVYGLGAVLYRMLTGRAPFGSTTLEALFRDILTRQPQSPRRHRPALPRDLEAVCLKCLEKDRSARYASAGDLADDLRRFLDARPTRARPLGWMGRSARSVQRLAPSTLAALVVLVPALWYVLDVTWLAPWARQVATLHQLRLGSVLLACGAAAWPLSVLVRRLWPLRRWVVAPALGALLALGAGTAWSIRAQATRQLHLDARLALEGKLASVGRSVGALEDYVEDWGERFDALDLQLVARGYLAVGRAPRAARWVERLAVEDPDNPLAIALSFALQDLFGVSLPEDEERLWATADRVRSWIIWKNVGQILRLAKRYDLARRAYVIAARDPAVQQHRLRPALAQLSLDLCQPDQAAAALGESLRALPADAALQREVLRVAFQTALGQGDWGAAQNHLDRFASVPGVPDLDVIDLRAEWLLTQGRLADLDAFVLRQAAAAVDNAAVLLWCGKQADGMVDRAGSVGLEKYQAAARFMQECYERVLASTPSSVAGQVGLSAALLRLAEYEGDAGAKLALLQRAEQHARRALALDEDYFEVQFNLSYVRRKLAELDHGSDLASMPEEALRSFLEPLRQAKERQSLEPIVLNDMAQGLAYLHLQRPDPALLDEASADIGRAIRLARGPAGSACEPWIYLNYLYDTQRQLFEQREEPVLALESARLALASAESTPTPPETIANRRAVVARLLRQLPDASPTAAPRN